MWYYHYHDKEQGGELFDRGANGDIYSGYVRIIKKPGHMVDFKGIDNHRVVDIHIHIVTAGAAVNNQ